LPHFPRLFGVEHLEYKWVALTVTTIGIFMVGLDARIVIIGLPQVAAQLKADAEQAIWITQSYVLATTVMLLLMGRLADIFGRIRIYSYGFAIFTIGSALTSIGMDPTQVIIFRAVQGFGAALIFANSIAIVTDSAPRAQLGLFVGINQIAYRAGALLGLTLSGLILSFFDWRALFYVNIPIGIFGTIWARKRLKETARLDENRRIDWLGFALFTVFLLSLMLSLTFSAYGTGELGLVYALLPVSAIFLVLFIVRERRINYPLLDFRMFKIKAVTGGITAVALNVIAWAAMLLLLSLQFQLILNESPLQAGLRILPFEIAFLAVGPLSGGLSDKFGYVRFTVSGLTLGSIALFLFSTTIESTSYAILSVYMVILGVGTGLFLAPNLRGVMGALPDQRRGIGSALVSLFLNIGLTVSLNFAILFMSFTAPYDLITRIISGLNPASLTVADKALFFSSVKNTYFALAVINALAIIPSLLQITRKRREKQEKVFVASAEA
jgi:EmrB/QacA subfamily drug resistance transporter